MLGSRVIGKTYALKSDWMEVQRMSFQPTDPYYEKVSLPPTPQDWKHHLVQDHFGAAARAYTTSQVHASGPDLAWFARFATTDGLLNRTGLGN